MKKFLISLFLAVPLLAVAQDANLKKWPEKADPKKVGLFIAEHFVESPHAAGNHMFYPETCTWLGALRFAKVTKNKELLKQLEERFLPLFGEKRHMLNSANHVDWNVFGSVPLELYMQIGQAPYLTMGLYYADEQWNTPEKPNPNNVEKYKNYDRLGLSWQTRFWIDDMYMITMVQSQAYRATGDRKYIDRTAREMHAYLDTLQQANGLFYHAPDVPYYWGRGNGWMAAGMSELLSALPEDNKDRPYIMEGYLKMMKTLKEYQREDGLWGQLIDGPDSWSETSGSGMFTYAFIMGVKHGWLPKEEYAPAAKKAWIALVDKIDEKGDIVDVCVGTNKFNDRQYYLDRPRKTGDMHGQAPLLWCATALLDK